MWLMHNASFVREKPISSLKVELGGYEGKSDVEPSEYLIGLLEDKTHARFASGVTKFERLLAPFGLDGFVGDSCRGALFELFKVRNAVLHRGAVADLQFVRECPWLGLSVGDKVVITHERFGHYLDAALEYVAVLIHRIGRNSARLDPRKHSMSIRLPASFHLLTTLELGTAFVATRWAMACGDLA